MTQLLTIKQVAEKLQVSERTVKRWVEKGTISSLKLSKAVRFREEHIEGWLNKRTIKAKS